MKSMSCEMMINWKFFPPLSSIKRSRALARLLICYLSRLVVGSSRARMRVLPQKTSAKASLMTIDASTFCPVEHLPFIYTFS
jgi:hypothetical protein